MSNCKVIALTNQKGGVGKTTTGTKGTGLADPSRNCKPFCCSRYAPEWEKPAHKDPSAKQENH